MGKINLVFGTNNAITTGTPDEEIETLYQRAFKPFLTTLYTFPDIALTLHYSGVLLEWFQDRHPEIIMLLNEMIKRGQIELLGGTYYETVLPMIPSSDRTAQIELLTTLIRRRFGKRPRGAWVTELIWEPSMPSSLNRSGMEYVFLEDSHFIDAGLRENELLEPVFTEDQGKMLLVFPVSAEVKLFPFTANPSRAVERIAGFASDEGRRVISVISDGEYFGHWKETGEILYKDGWLAGFLEALRTEKGTINTTHPGHYRQRDREYAKHYFSCTSYEEMMSWSLPTERAHELEKLKSGRLSRNNRAYLKGGYFRHFLSKYPESNLMYAKMIHTYVLVNQVRGDKYRKKAAREELWKGENHSAYWHGKRSGVYRNESRKAVYSALIAAEKTSRQRGVFKSHVSVEDFDSDGMNEYLFHGNELNMYVHRKGGMVFELDYMTNPWNYMDTFTRQSESYDDLLDTRRIVDMYPRKSFMDHFFSSTEKISDFENMTYSELGGFLLQPYDGKECRKEHLDLTLSARADVRIGSKTFPVLLEKRYRMKRNSISVDYTIKNESSDRFSVSFAPELNLSFACVNDSVLSLSIQRAGKAARTVSHGITSDTGVSGFAAKDGKNSVTIEGGWDKECDLWILPVDALWRDEEGNHAEYQSTCLLPVWPLTLSPNEVWKTALRLAFIRGK